MFDVEPIEVVKKCQCMYIYVYVCFSERFSFASCKRQSKEKKERKANCQGCKNALVLTFNQLKKLKGEEEGEKREEKINSHIFCLVLFSFPIHEPIVVAFQRLVYLEENESIESHHSENDLLSYRDQFYISIFVHLRVITNVKFLNSMLGLQKIWDRNLFHFDYHIGLEEDRETWHELYSPLKIVLVEGEKFQ